MTLKYKSSHKSLVAKKSYGIFCARFNNKTKKIEFLLIQKRITFSYMEFILKTHFTHKLYDESKLLFLFDRMTHEEKLDILSLDFGKMWYRIWMVDPNFDKTQISPEKYERFINYKNNFEKTFLFDKGKKLKELINK